MQLGMLNRSVHIIYANHADRITTMIEHLKVCHIAMPAQSCCQAALTTNQIVSKYQKHSKMNLTPFYLIGCAFDI